MSTIKQIEDSQGNVVYPQTHESAVIDAEGTALSTKLTQLASAVSIEPTSSAGSNWSNFNIR